jgi:hypothetical protein
MTQEQTLGLIRHFLSGLGSIAIYRGWIDEATALEVTGALMVLISFGWSFWTKRKA